jgi:hypothetical protein
MPVGHRLAYDPERGRLWVVCARCGEWNLTPLEERWEALEECERLFAAAQVRASNSHVGLGRADGVDLLRVGAAAVRDELANWRYGPRLRRRHRRAAVILGGAGVVAGAAIGGALLAGAASGSLPFAAWSVLFISVWTIEMWGRLGPVGGARFTGPNGERVTIAGPLVEEIRLTRTTGANGPRTIGIVASLGDKELRYGREGALVALAAVLPRLNWRGADEWDLRRATRIVDEEEALAAEVTQRGGNPQPPWQRLAMVHWPHDDRIASMEPIARLAFEMAVTEELERRALAGEAAGLEGQWREAEEVASIADSLFLPTFVTEWLARRSGKARTKAQR